MGFRLAQVTLRDVYGRSDLVASGPVVEAVTALRTRSRSGLQISGSSGAAGYTIAFGPAESAGLAVAGTPNCSYVANLLNGSYMPPPAACCDVSPFEVLTSAGV